MESRAVQRDDRRANLTLECRDIQFGAEHASARIENRRTSDCCAGADDGASETQSLERHDRVRAERDAGARGLQLGRTFENGDGNTAAAQGDGERETADPGAGNGDGRRPGVIQRAWAVPPTRSRPAALGLAQAAGGADSTTVSI
jgi:hypothetical protein